MGVTYRHIAGRKRKKIYVMNRNHCHMGENQIVVLQRVNISLLLKGDSGGYGRDSS